MICRQFIRCELKELSATKLLAQVFIAQSFIEQLYHATACCLAKNANLVGFVQGTIPISYIERNYEMAIINHMIHVLRTFVIDDFLIDELKLRGFIVLGDAICDAIVVKPREEAFFSFLISTISLSIHSGWRQANFKLPVRKNYRDLDNQVASFLSEEQLIAKEHIPDKILYLDWINFTIVPLNDNSTFLADDPLKLWLKIGNEDPDKEAQMLFLEKSPREHLQTKARFLQEYFATLHENQYFFDLHVVAHTPHKLFCFDTFKKYFKIRGEKDFLKKLIEVFSFRHDISLRRETVEEAFKVLLKIYPFNVSNELIVVRSAELLQDICATSDYYVYKSQPDFQRKIHLLAQKQLKEAALIDAIAYAEKIEITTEDILGYINLLKRRRTEEFVYFHLPSTRMRERERPISDAKMRQICLREKTLNHLVRGLSQGSV